jgi:hypothetical protein
MVVVVVIVVGCEVSVIGYRFSLHVSRVTRDGKGRMYASLLDRLFEKGLIEVQVDFNFIRYYSHHDLTVHLGVNFAGHR